MLSDEIKKMLADQLNIKVSKITDKSKFTEDLGADSLDMIDMLTKLEDKFGITVPDEEVQNLKTVGDVIKFVEKTKTSKTKVKIRTRRKS